MCNHRKKKQTKVLGNYFLLSEQTHDYEMGKIIRLKI